MALKKPLAAASTTSSTTAASMTYSTNEMPSSPLRTVVAWARAASRSARAATASVRRLATSIQPPSAKG